MKTSLSVQERLKDLRVEHQLTLEQLAQEVPISRSALGAYESDEYKDISHINLIALAKYYGVSTDYLLGLTDNRKHANTELAELHLDDDAVALLKSGRINNRLLCEVMCHPAFPKLMADIEIYVDGIATMQNTTLNDRMYVLRTQIKQAEGEGTTSQYLRIVERSRLHEEEFFFHVTNEDWQEILRALRLEHKDDREAASDEDRATVQMIRSFQNSIKCAANPLEKLSQTICEVFAIDYRK